MRWVGCGRNVLLIHLSEVTSSLPTALENGLWSVHDDHVTARTMTHPASRSLCLRATFFLMLATRGAVNVAKRGPRPFGQMCNGALQNACTKSSSRLMLSALRSSIRGQGIAKRHIYAILSILRSLHYCFERDSRLRRKVSTPCPVFCCI